MTVFVNNDCEAHDCQCTNQIHISHECSGLIAGSVLVTVDAGICENDVMVDRSVVVARN